MASLREQLQSGARLKQTPLVVPLWDGEAVTLRELSAGQRVALYEESVKHEPEGTPDGFDQMGFLGRLIAWTVRDDDGPLFADHLAVLAQVDQDAFNFLSAECLKHSKLNRGAVEEEEKNSSAPPSDDSITP